LEDCEVIKKGEVLDTSDILKLFYTQVTNEKKLIGDDEKVLKLLMVYSEIARRERKASGEQLRRNFNCQYPAACTLCSGQCSSVSPVKQLN